MAADRPDPGSKASMKRRAPPEDALLTARILVARAESLQALQADAQSRGMLTARYRLRAGPVFGNLLAAFARDMQQIRRDPADAVRGDLLPQPVLSEWSRQLESTAWPALDELIDLPQGGSGVVGPPWLSALWRALSLDGRRLLLLCEIEGDPGTAGEWESALRTLLDDGELGRDAALVFSAAPDGWRDVAPDERTAEIDAPSSADVRQDEVFTFVEAALSGDQPADVDQLGMAPLADALARLLLLDQTRPLTVGIQAPWGWGKSSFVAFVREALIRRAPANDRSPALDELAEIRRALDHAAVQAGLSDADQRTRDGAEAAFAATVAVKKERRDELLSKLERNARRDVICVDFNAWRFEGSQQVWAGLAETLTRALEAAVPRRSRLGSRLKYAIRKRRVEFWAGFVVPVGLAAVAALAAVALGAADAGDELSGWNGWLDTLVPIASVAFVAWRFFSVVQPVSERVAGYVTGPDHAARIGYQNEVINDLKFLRGEIDGDPRIVVAVDDLDRCSDESIMETLQAINLVLGASDFFVLLAIDPEMIHRAIARRRGLDDDDPLARPFAENYLRKIIQLPLHLPERSAAQRFNFVSQLFSQAAQQSYRSSNNGTAPAATRGTDGEQGGARAPFAFDAAAVASPRVQKLREVQDTKDELDALDSFKEFLRDNPRELKRLVNVHRLVKIHLQRPDAPPTAANQRKLVVWLVFCARWPQLVDAVLEHAATAGGDGDCIAAVAGGDGELGRFVHALRNDKLTPTDLAPEGTLASAARISLIVDDRPVGGAAPQPVSAA